jgi:hypothetical protein
VPAFPENSERHCISTRAVHDECEYPRLGEIEYVSRDKSIGTLSKVLSLKRLALTRSHNPYYLLVAVACSFVVLYLSVVSSSLFSLRKVPYRTVQAFLRFYLSFCSPKLQYFPFPLLLSIVWYFRGSKPSNPGMCVLSVNSISLVGQQLPIVQ